MSALRTAWTELRRLLATRLGRMSLMALVLIPTIYSGLYLYANLDPYDGLDRVPAALVVADEPVDVDGEEKHLGRDLADELLEQKDFDWHAVDGSEAKKGVREGTYDFALTIPQDFTEALTSSSRFEPERAQLRLTTNDANSYLSTTMATTVAGKVRDAVAQQVGQESADVLLSSIQEIGSGLDDAADGGKDVATGARDARDGATSLGSGAARAADGARSLSDGAGTLAEGTGTLSKGAKKLTKGTGSLADGADSLAQGTGSLNSGASSLAQGTGTLATGARDLADGLGTLEESTASLPEDTRALADGARNVADGTATLGGLGTQLEEGSKAIGTAYAQTRAGLVATMTRQGVPADQQAELLAVYDQLSTPLTSLGSSLGDTSGQLAALVAGADQVAAGAEKLADASPTLVDGIEQASTGAEKLATGAAEASNGAAQLATGATQADTGAKKLATGAGSVDEGASDLASGARELDGGAGRLASGAGDLSSGTAELADGARRLSDGLGTLASGSGKLARALADGAGDVPTISDETRDRMAAVLGDPVDVAGDSQAEASTYGAGLAPFFLALATWIGGYVLFLVVRPLSRRAIAANASSLRVALGGWLTPALLGVAQVTVMVLVAARVVGVGVADTFGTWAFMLLVTASFIAIVHLLNAALGQAGQFLGLVMMVLQLVTAGGTFPWQTIPTPLHVVHHAMPMSYAVDGLRQLMYGGDMARVALCAAVLVAWGVGSLALTTLVARRQRTWSVARLLAKEV